MKIKRLKLLLLIPVFTLLCSCNTDDRPVATTTEPAPKNYHQDYFGNPIDTSEEDKNLGNNYHTLPVVNVAVFDEVRAYNTFANTELAKDKDLIFTLEESLDENAEFSQLEIDDEIADMTVVEAETTYLKDDVKTDADGEKIYYYLVMTTRVKFSGQKTLKGYITLTKSGEDTEEILFFPDDGEWSGMPCITRHPSDLPVARYRIGEESGFRYLSRGNYILLNNDSGTDSDNIIGKINEGEYKHVTVTIDELEMISDDYRHVYIAEYMSVDIG